MTCLSARTLWISFEINVVSMYVERLSEKVYCRTISFSPKLDSESHKLLPVVELREESFLFKWWNNFESIHTLRAPARFVLIILAHQCAFWDFFSFFFFRDFIFWGVLGSEQNWVEDTEISVPLDPTYAQLLHYQHPQPDWSFCYTWRMHTDISLPKVHSECQGSCGCCMFCGFGQICNDMNPQLKCHTE